MLESLTSIGPIGLAICAGAVLLAAFARGYAGFGLSAIVLAGLTLVLPPIQVVPLAIMLEVTASCLQMRGARKLIDWRILAFLLIGAAIGNPIGVQALQLVSSEAMRITILSFILVASLVLFAGIRSKLGTTGLSTFAVGIGSGIANGAAALGGLPIALFLTASATTAATMRATLIAYFLISDSYVAGLLYVDGIIDAKALWRVLAALPLLTLGVWLGSRRFLHTSPDSFRQFALVLLIALSIIGLAKSFV